MVNIDKYDHVTPLLYAALIPSDIRAPLFLLKEKVHYKRNLG